MASTDLLFINPPIVGSTVHLVFGGGAVPAGVVGTGFGDLIFEGGAAAAHGIAGAGVGALSFAGSGAGEHASPGVEGAGVGALAFTGAAAAAHGIAGSATGALSFAAVAAAAHGIAGTGAGVLALTGDGAAAHGIAAAGAGALGFIGTCAALHLRYEVRGEVSMGGLLVDRRVRCYKRSTGELMGQADTAAGLYRVHAGFDDAEVYTLAIHLDEAATDWIPPTANRLVPVLAEDAA